jgi:hypothetical protein
MNPLKALPLPAKIQGLQFFHPKNREGLENQDPPSTARAGNPQTEFPAFSIPVPALAGKLRNKAGKGGNRPKG